MFMVATRRILFAVLILVFTRAEALQELDRIVAVVDDDVVLASELLQRADAVRQQMRAENVPMPGEQVLLSQMMERLILESIQLQMGQRAGVRIDDEQLTNAIESIARQNGMDFFEFQRALAQDGIDYRDFREDVRREMVIARVQRGAVGQRVQVTGEEIRAFLESPLGQQVISDEYRVGHILLAVPENASDAVEERAAAEAEEIYRRLVDGADFREMAVAHSASARALEGGDLGWRPAGELPSLFAERVLELSVGETAQPLRGGGGYHIIQLLDRRGAGTAVSEQTRLRHILVRPTEIRSIEEARLLIEDIHRQLQQGASFGDLARRYSDDPGSAQAGGELGWSEADQFVPQFADTVRAIGEGEISDPFETQFGWHVLQVQERRVRQIGDEARRTMAARVLQNRRFEEELEAWLREIRDEAFVDVRL
jgi:peptidyl-prolyl cis-trans isomerase SurA